MNLTYFYPKIRGNVENKNNSPVNVRFVPQTSDIRNFSENIRSDVETWEVATLLIEYAIACCINGLASFICL